MATQYNLNVIHSVSINIDNAFIVAYVLDNEQYWNIHILDDWYREDYLNTLKQQIPKDSIDINLLDDVFLYKVICEHYLWHKTYGYKGKVYNFDVTSCIDLDLKEAGLC